MKPYFQVIIQHLVGASIRQLEADILLKPDTFNHYPEHLYKYRSCERTFSFESLEQEYLWADYPTKFDDPLDAAVNHKLKSELPSIEKWFYQHLGEIIYYSIPPKGMKKSKQGQTLESYKKAQKHFVNEEGKKAQVSFSAIKNELTTLPVLQRQKVFDIFKDFETPEFERTVENAIRDTLNNFVNAFRNNTMMACLTARKDNQKMWEDYAGKYTGFVIEYKRPDYNCLNDEQKQLIQNLFPVSYYKRIPSVPLLPFIEYAFQKEVYGKTIDITDPMERLFCQMLYKKYEYSSEEEWRLITESKEHKIPFPYVSAVYAGYKIDDENLNRLKIICEKKKIPLHKQEISLLAGTMTFKEFP